MTTIPFPRTLTVPSPWQPTRLPRLCAWRLFVLGAAALVAAQPCLAAGASGCAPHGSPAPTAAATGEAMPEGCPLHAAHMAAASATSGDPAAHRHDVEALNARGDVAMGFSQQATEHHFRLAADGGAIEVTVREATDAASLQAIRSHLRTIAVAFAAGDFSTPQAVHAQVPPGVEGMRAAGAAIAYRYEELPAGARVRLTATDAAALAAVHDFLRFQIRDHGTGDPPEVVASRRR
jgi:hypothetical protein